MHCKKYKADIPQKTCVARQKILNRGYIRGKPIDRYEGCRDCETGVALYQNHLKEKKDMKEKICRTCKKSLPADRDFFDLACRAADKLTNDCTDCRRKASGLHPGIKPDGTKSDVKKPEKPTSVDVEPVKTKTATPADPAPSAGTCITLDFSKYPELLERVKLLAGENMRNPDQQILFCLKDYAPSIFCLKETTLSAQPELTSKEA